MHLWRGNHASIGRQQSDHFEITHQVRYQLQVAGKTIIIEINCFSALSKSIYRYPKTIAVSLKADLEMKLHPFSIEVWLYVGPLIELGEPSVIK